MVTGSGRTQRRVTSWDVAAKAGVSRTTVSYVLNNTPGQSIPAETREAVHRAARDLQYRPHAGARALRSGRSDTVLFPMPGVEIQQIGADMINACAIALAEHKLTMVTDTTSYETSQAQVEAWLRLGPAAVIDLMLRHDDPAREELENAGVPVLTGAHMDRPAALRPIDTIADQARAVQIEHLLADGRRTIIAAIPSSARPVYRGRGRMAGMRRAARRAGATLTIEEVELDRDGMHAAMTEWLARSPRPDGICAYNDEWAVGLLDALGANKIRVPDEIAVIGVNDEPIARVVTPTITTVGWPVEVFGHAVATATAALLRGEGSTHEFPLPDLTVVVRESA